MSGRWGGRASNNAGARDGGPGSGHKPGQYEDAMKELRKNISGLEAGSEEHRKDSEEFNKSAKALGFKSRMGRSK